MTDAPEMRLMIEDANISVSMGTTASATQGPIPATVKIAVPNWENDAPDEVVVLHSVDREALAFTFREIARALEFGIKSQRGIEVTFLEG